MHERTGARGRGGCGWLLAFLLPAPPHDLFCRRQGVLGVNVLTFEFSKKKNVLTFGLGRWYGVVFFLVAGR